MPSLFGFTVAADSCLTADSKSTEMVEETPAELILFNITPDTKDFLLVIGEYNAQVCRGFGQPVVALSPSGWHADYRFRHPFWMMKRAEFVISRVAPAVTGSVVLPSRADPALSADFATNVAVMKSIAKDPWLRKHVIMSNAGVFAVAQQRFNCRDAFARQEYLKQFVECPQPEHVRMIADFCTPPSKHPVLSAPTAPPKPAFDTPFQWDMASPEVKAAALYGWQDWWMNPTPSIAPTSGAGSKVVLPVSTENDDPASTENWKGAPPTADERKSWDDWNKA
jgi:hypothetical protein